MNESYSNFKPKICSVLSFVLIKEDFIKVVSFLFFISNIQSMKIKPNFINI